MKINDITLAVLWCYIVSMALYTCWPCAITSCILIIDTAALIVYFILAAIRRYFNINIFTIRGQRYE